LRKDYGQYGIVHSTMVCEVPLRVICVTAVLEQDEERDNTPVVHPYMACGAAFCRTEPLPEYLCWIENSSGIVRLKTETCKTQKGNLY